MADSSEVLDRAALRNFADSGLRLVALSFVDEAESAADKVRTPETSPESEDSTPDDALHDFRVALRRLRSWLRAFNSELRPSVKSRHLKRLSSIVAATNSARDSDVQTKWLDTQQYEPDSPQRAGYEWMQAHLRKGQTNALDDALDAVDRFDRLTPKIRGRLKKGAEPFGALMADAITDAASILETRLSRIHNWNDVKRAHRARIAAKRLRYLIDPVSKLATGGGEIIESLKTLQDLLGDLHDVHVFSSELARASRKCTEEAEPGLIDLSKRAQSRGESLYNEIARDWLDGAAAPFFEKVRAFADELSRAAATETETRPVTPIQQQSELPSGLRPLIRQQSQAPALTHR